MMSNKLRKGSINAATCKNSLKNQTSRLASLFFALLHLMLMMNLERRPWKCQM